MCKTTVYAIVTIDSRYEDADPWVDVFTDRETAMRYVDELLDRFDKYGVIEYMYVTWHEVPLNDNEIHLICADEVYGTEEEEA